MEVSTCVLTTRPTLRSILPGRINAGSSMSGLLVAAITIIFFKPCAVVTAAVSYSQRCVAAINTCCVYLHSIQLGLKAQNTDACQQQRHNKSSAQQAHQQLGQHSIAHSGRGVPSPRGQRVDLVEEHDRGTGSSGAAEQRLHGLLTLSKPLAEQLRTPHCVCLSMAPSWCSSSEVTITSGENLQLSCE